MGKYKLSDIAVVNPKDKFEDLSISVSFVPMQNVSENGEIDVSQTRSALEVSKGFTSFIDGDVLMAKITPCMENGKGAVATGLCNGRGFGSTEFFVIRPDYSKVRSEWIYYYTIQKQFRLECERNMTGSAGQKRVPKAYLENREIEIPTLAEQDDILRRLRKTKRILALYQQQLQNLDEIIRARFVELFGDPVSNPLGWEKRTLKEICIKLNDGTHFSPESFETGEYKYITAKNIKMSGFDFSNITYVPEEVHRPIYERCNPEYGDVLYIKDGATTGIAMVNTLEEEFTLLSSVALLKQDRTIINGYFLTSLLNNKDMYLNIRNNMGGAAITRLTIAKLNAIKVIVPPIRIQNQFADFVQAVDKSKVIAATTLKKLTFFRNICYNNSKDF